MPLIINSYTFAVTGFGTHDWTNITGTSSGNNSGSSTNAPASVTLKTTISGVSGTGTLRCRPNIAGSPAGTNLTCANGATDSYAITAGQAIYYQATITGLPGDGKTCTVTITDETNGGATVDTFTIGLDVP